MEDGAAMVEVTGFFVRGILKYFWTDKINYCAVDPSPVLVCFCCFDALDGNIYTIVRLSNKYNIKRLINDSIRFIKAQQEPKLLYRQLMDEFGLEELAKHLTDERLNNRITTACIKKEIAEFPHLDPRVALRAAM